MSTSTDPPDGRSVSRLGGLIVACLVIGTPALALLHTPAPAPVAVSEAPSTTAAAPDAPTAPAPIAATTTTSGREILVRVADGPLAGQLAPPVTYITFDGIKASLTTYLGEPVILGFFASWCPSCQDEIQNFANYSAILYGHVPILAVAIRDDEGAARDLVAKVGRSYLLAGIDRDGSIAASYLMLGVPGTVIIGPDGKVAKDWRGPVAINDVVQFLRCRYPDVVVPVAGPGDPTKC